MKIHRIYPIITTVTAVTLTMLLVYGCQGDPEAQSADQTSESKPTDAPEAAAANVIVLLDLSDRIDTARFPHQAERDLHRAEDIVNAFSAGQLQYGYMVSRDKLTITMAKQAQTSYEAFDFSEGLSINMGAGMNKPKFDQQKDELLTKVSLLYQQAIGNPTSGADIWSWFRDELPDMLDPNARNKLIILTDGYMTFERSTTQQKHTGTCMRIEELAQLRQSTNIKQTFEQRGIGLHPHPGNYPSLEAIVLEVTPEHPERYTNEMDILRHYWETWLQQMNIKSSIHPSFTNREVSERKIREFLGLDYLDTP